MGKRKRGHLEYRPSLMRGGAWQTDKEAPELDSKAAAVSGVPLVHRKPLTECQNLVYSTYRVSDTVIHSTDSSQCGRGEADG